MNRILLRNEVIDEERSPRTFTSNAALSYFHNMWLETWRSWVRASWYNYENNRQDVVM